MQAKHFLSMGLVALVVAGIFFSIKEARVLSAAKEALPAACMLQLDMLSEKTARQRGVALSDCIFASSSAQVTAALIGQTEGEGTIMQVSRPDGAGAVVNTLSQIEIRDARLYLNEVIAQGTGCNGGIESARIVEDVLSYGINLTPAALLALSPTRDQNKKMKEGDVANRPQDCFAKIVFTNKLPVMVQFLQEASLPEEEAALFPKQLCFEGLVAARIHQGRAVLSFPDEYMTFVSEYDKLCY